MTGHIFTSDLSIDELLLVEEVGFEPLELVLGSAYFNIGWAGTSAPWTTNMELTNISHVMLTARQTAMQRLLVQAAQVGADGVVGMRIEMERSHHNAEFIAIGTAVKRRAGDGAAWRDAWGRPFTCDLSGADFWGLVRAGYRPVTLAHGVCVYHVAHQSLGLWWKSLGQGSVNQEHVAFTSALYEARELAMSRMQAEAWKHGATAGVVAMDVHEGSHGWDSHVLELMVVGTGVAPIVDATHETHEPPKLVMFAHDA